MQGILAYSRKSAYQRICAHACGGFVDGCLAMLSQDPPYLASKRARKWSWVIIFSFTVPGHMLSLFSGISLSSHEYSHPSFYFGDWGTPKWHPFSYGTLGLSHNRWPRPLRCVERCVGDITAAPACSWPHPVAQRRLGGILIILVSTKIFTRTFGSVREACISSGHRPTSISHLQ